MLTSMLTLGMIRSPSPIHLGWKKVKIKTKAKNQIRIKTKAKTLRPLNTVRVKLHDRRGFLWHSTPLVSSLDLPWKKVLQGH